MRARDKTPNTLIRLLDLATLFVGVCAITFLYLPSVVLAFAVGRLGNLTLPHKG